jgi:thiamine kinase-like enzyme
VHGDFRLGNLFVGRTGLAAVLDWEMVHLGDPHEDVAWATIRAWRFDRHRPPEIFPEPEPSAAADNAAVGPVQAVDPDACVGGRLAEHGLGPSSAPCRLGDTSTDWCSHSSMP